MLHRAAYALLSAHATRSPCAEIGACFIIVTSNCTEVVLSKLPKLPSQCYSNWAGNFGNLGSNKEIWPECINKQTSSACTVEPVNACRNSG